MNSKEMNVSRVAAIRANNRHRDQSALANCTLHCIPLHPFLSSTRAALFCFRELLRVRVRVRAQVDCADVERSQSSQLMLVFSVCTFNTRSVCRANMNSSAMAAKTLAVALLFEYSLRGEATSDLQIAPLLRLPNIR